MAFLIGGANSAADTGYDIDNSLRYNDGDSPYFTRTSETPTNDDMVTISVWLKRSSNFGANQTIISWDSGNGAQAYIRFATSADFIALYNVAASETATNIITNAKLRDPSAWYHLVLQYDAAQGTDTNRVKIYLNGILQSLGTANYPPQNTPLAFNVASRTINIGRWAADSEYYDGYMADFHYIDGAIKAHTDFGETDEDSGIWKPKKYTGGSYGTNGFFLEFKGTGTSADASGKGADTSGNDNHWDDNNLAATDQTTDTPTNNFATLNPIDKAGSGAITFSEGNLKAAVEDNGNARGNFFVNSGKWYWETLIVSGDSVSTVGIAEPGFYSGNLFDGSSTAKGYIYINDGNKRSPAGSASSYGDSYADDDIIGVALNMDDGEVTFYKNNSTQDVAFSSLSGDHGIYYQGYGGTATVILNTGNPAFSISSGNADANGYGNFEYAPPSGFYALCTKNLAEFG